MNRKFIITGTGTDIGKTLASAILMLGLDADYWKPIQSGTPTDTDTLRTLTGFPPSRLSGPRFHRESYCFKNPLSPHLAAEMEHTQIDIAHIHVPPTPHPMIIEGAGGVMVPITRHLLMVDLFKSLHMPAILCARTELGTINHTLLSIEALRMHSIPLLGLIFIGPDMPDTTHTILEFTKAKMLGHIPMLDDFSPHTLKNVFDRNFIKADFFS